MKIKELDNLVRPVVYKLTRQNKEKKIKHLISMLNTAYFRLRPHRDAISVYRHDVGDAFKVKLTSTSFVSRDLTAWFGKRYKDLISPFFQFSEDAKSYAYRNKYYWEIEEYEDNHPELNSGQRELVNLYKARLPRLTKAYMLKPDIITKLDDIWKSDSTATIYDKNSDTVISQVDLPQNGICVTSFSKLRVPSVLEFDVRILNKIISNIEQELSSNSNQNGIEDYDKQIQLRHLYRIRKWTLSFGGIPNLYRDYEFEPTDKNGRLWGIGSVHVQSIKRTVREHLYKGKGWFDYDIRKCHYSLLNSLAHAYGYQTEILHEYVINPQDFDSRISRETHISESKLKPILTSLIFGAPISSNTETSIGKNVQFIDNGIENLQGNEIVGKLIKDIRSIRDIVIHEHTDYVSDELFNVVGKRKSLQEEVKVKGKIKNRRISKPRALSFILTGYEAWTINVVCENNDNILAIMHDGFTAKQPINVQMAESQIFDRSISEFGFPLVIQLKEEKK